ncbi:sugar-transfer associated ATP-grasp domain-containing protein [Erythrobacter sp. HA6-11]
MSFVIRFPTGPFADAGSLAAVHSRLLKEHWPAHARALASLTRKAMATYGARKAGNYAEDAPAPLIAQNNARLSLLPIETLWTLQTMAEPAWDEVLPEHVKKAIFALLNREAVPYSENLLLDKARFARHMRSAGLAMPQTFDVEEDVPDWALDAQRLIAKPGFGSQGRGIRMLERAGHGRVKVDGEERDLRSWCADNLQLGDVVQSVEAPHPGIATISPGALATMRTITCLDENGEPEVVRVALRLGGGESFLDNLHAGGVAMRVDMAAGQTTLGFQRAERRFLRQVEVHPGTQAPLAGHAVPGFAEALELARAAHRAMPNSWTVIGWDIGISARGPLLIEGNWDAGNGTMQYVAGEPIGSGRLGQLLKFQLENLPSERWRSAKPITHCKREAPRKRR